MGTERLREDLELQDYLNTHSFSFVRLFTCIEDYTAQEA